ncbi:restriction endonuclease subunit S [Dyadobacter sp. BHUBP1]|uniref:restriction endonuclease subunit S n=1 Tax=Dyadobacter sp. BHUBP1 TaxID=3424178 RepID=UPI003D334F67
MTEQTNPYDIPETWVWTTLDNIGLIVGGGTPATDEPAFWGGRIPWITPADLSSHAGKLVFGGARTITEEGLNNSSAIVLPPQAVLFSSRAPIGYVAIAGMELATNQGFKSIVPLQEMSSDYVYFYLKFAKDEAIKRASGTTFLEISGAAFAKIPIPLPSYGEQRRIVAKLEELLSEINSSEQYLRQATKQLSIFREAILEQAFTGELTKEYRESQGLNSTAEVLSDINSEIHKAYQNEVDEWHGAVRTWIEGGKKGTKPRRTITKHKKNISTLPTESHPYHIPDGWCWVRSESLLSYVTSGSRDWKKYYSSEGSYFIRTQDIKTNTLVYDNAAFVKLPDHVEGKRSRIQKGDLLMTITGANVGKIAHVSVDPPEAYVSQSVALIRPLLKELSPYLHMYLQATTTGAKFIEEMVYGVGRPVLSLVNMNDIPIPLCSFQEQKEILSLVAEKLSLIGNLEQAIELGFQQVQLLREAIMKRAFTGKLVDQHLEEGTGQELLERLLSKMEANKAKFKKDHAIKRRTKAVPDLDLIKLQMRKHFPTDEFTVDQLRKYVKVSPERFKDAFFKMLEEGTFVESRFDLNSETRLYKIRR